MRSSMVFDDTFCGHSRGDFSSFWLNAMRRVACRRRGVLAVDEVPWGDGKTIFLLSTSLVFCRPLRAVDHKGIDRSFGGLQLEPHSLK